METTNQDKPTTETTNQDTPTKPKKQFFANNKLAIVAVAGIVVLAAAAFIFINQSSDTNAVARVNGEEITQKELDARVQQLQAQQQGGAANKEQLQKAALDQLIGQKLLGQEAKKAGISVSSQEVDAQLDQIVSQFETDQQYQQTLATNGLTEQELKANIEQDLLVQKYLEGEISEESTAPTEQEVQQQYENFTDQAEDAPPLEDLRPQIEQQIQNSKFNEKARAVLQNLRSQSEIEILI